jgi:hypothetical protein
MLHAGHIRQGIKYFLVVLIPIVVWCAYARSWDVFSLWRDGWKLVVALGLCLVSAQLPDVDIKSTSQRRVYAIGVLLDGVLILFRYYQEAAVLGFVAMLPMLTKHRGVLHRLFTGMILLSPLLAMPMVMAGTPDLRHLGVPYYLAGIAGYLSHLRGDRRKT